jgi:hypothetical protein
MSREIRVRVAIAEGGIEGYYKTEFTSPLVIDSCKHHRERVKKGTIRKKEWWRTFHGRPDGSNSVEWDCSIPNENRK